MTDTHPAAPRPRWLRIAAIWFAGAVFESSQSIFMFHSEGKHSGELRLFFTELVTWLPWALATPAVVSLARRYPVLPRPTLRGAATHLLALVAISLTAEAWSAMLQVAFNPWGKRHAPAFWDTFSTTLIYQALNCLAAYALILTVTYLVDSRERIARQMTEAARLNEELSNAQLAALRRQMEPHFMFNTLNAIAGLVRDQRNGAAVNMIVGLSEFLRRASDNSHRPQVTLGEELDYLQRYLEIQKVRFGDRLQVSLDVPEALLAAQVPNLLLQPLVENAIKHGIAQRVEGGSVQVTGARRDGALCLSVRNDGPKVPADEPAARKGVGLDNLRTRLRILHGEAANLRLVTQPSGETEVAVTLPFVEA